MRARAQGEPARKKRCREGEWQTGSGGAACGEGGTTSHGGDRESSLHNLGADGWDGMAGWQYYYSTFSTFPVTDADFFIQASIRHGDSASSWSWITTRFGVAL